MAPSSTTRSNFGLAVFAALQTCITAAPTSQHSLKFGSSIVEVPQRWREVFPAADFNRKVTEPIWNATSTSGSGSSGLQRDLDALRDASFVAYDDRFYDLLGVDDVQGNKSHEKVFTFPPPPSYADRQVHDATAYSPECDCMFFNQMYVPKDGESFPGVDHVWRVSNVSSDDQADVKVEKVYPKPSLVIPNGAYYYNGSIYWADEGNFTTPGGIVRMDPATLETEVVLNNYMGRRFNSPNDVTVTKGGVVFFTDGYYGYEGFHSTIKPEQANGIWRWDMNTGDLRQVAGAGSHDPLWNPNGMALNQNETTLYGTSRSESSSDFDGQRTIYTFDVGDHSISAATIFAYTDTGFPDGVKTDSAGNVYGGTVDSVDVWDHEGTLLGKIKCEPGDSTTNMQFVGNWLYFTGREFLYRVKLTTGNAQSYEYN